MSIPKYIVRTLCITCLILVNCGDTANSEPVANPVFQPILPVLERQTQVPILLPSRLPTEGFVEVNGFFQLYAIVETATTFEYRIILGFDEQCNGGNACRYGYVSGKVITPITLPINEEYEVDPTYQPLRSPEAPRFISLVNGVRGYFLPYTCAAFCSDSYLAWDLNGYRYMVSIKSGTIKELVKLANSAISNNN